MKKQIIIGILGILFLLSTGFYIVHGVGFDAGIIAMDIGLGYQEIDVNSIIVANMIAQEQKMWATKKVIFPSTDIDAVLLNFDDIGGDKEPSKFDPIGFLVWIFSPSTCHACDKPSGCQETPTINNNQSAVAQAFSGGMIMYFIVTNDILKPCRVEQREDTGNQYHTFDSTCRVSESMIDAVREITGVDNVFYDGKFALQVWKARLFDWDEIDMAVITTMQIYGGRK